MGPLIALGQSKEETSPPKAKESTILPPQQVLPQKIPPRLSIQVNNSNLLKAAKTAATKITESLNIRNEKIVELIDSHQDN
ncbi:22372_t:CDS:2 [Dentiscutata erythropus]|uniref:22372_t:CDS:1 n=1 Tax=Dentiscutata erythropus TaxID=1348616 RepID=A0A9N9ACW8_9GLOM|nr:22372_t:CDS:2 [Dentiscutata erythropus]